MWRSLGRNRGHQPGYSLPLHREHYASGPTRSQNIRFALKHCVEVRQELRARKCGVPEEDSSEQAGRSLAADTSLFKDQRKTGSDVRARRV